MKKNEKIADNGIRVGSDNKFLRWLDNFWYHYKWPALGVIFAAVVITVCSIQMFSRDKYDITLVYAGPATNVAEGISEVISPLLPDDFNNDGEKKVTTATYNILSEDEIRAIEAETDSDGKPQRVDTSFQVDERENYQSHRQTGDVSVSLLSPYVYNEMVSKKYLCPMSEIFGDKLPEGVTADGYGIRLGDTAIYREYQVLQKLPEDTIICLELPLASEKLSKSAQKKVDFEKSVFRAIVEFTPKDGEVK